MTLTSLSLHQYAIALSPSLPVGKQRIDWRYGLVLTASTDSRSEHVEIAPLSGNDSQGHEITGFSRESLAQASEALKTWLAGAKGQSVDYLLDSAASTQLACVAFGLSLLHAKLVGQLDCCHSTNSAPSSQAKIPLIYRHTNEALSQLQQRLHALPAQTRVVKVKVAQAALADEISLIHAILAIRPKLKIRLDANRGFTLEQAIEFAACLPSDAIEYIEEPCNNWRDNEKFYQAIGMPWALDETLNDPDYRFKMLSGLKALVLKPMLIGSLETLQQLQQQAEAYGVRCILSSCLEASLGINDLAKLSQLITPTEIPGLDTLSAFTQDLIQPTDNKPCLQLDELSLVMSTE